MSTEFLDLEQGSQEWQDLRGQYYTASEADAMMGTSKYKSRHDLLVEKKTGIKPVVSEYLQGIFEQGHHNEEWARARVEQGLFGFALDPLTAIKDNRFLSSLDGINLVNEVVWECKTWNKHLAEHVLEGVIPESHKWQLVHQCYTTGIDKVLFSIADEEKELLESAWFHPTEDDFAQLISGWNDFEGELAHFEVSNPLDDMDFNEARDEALRLADEKLTEYLVMRSLWVEYDFNQAIKGKRNIRTVQAAIDEHMAASKANAKPSIHVELAMWANRHDIKLTGKILADLDPILIKYGVKL